MEKEKTYILGLMSGTSLDGVDIVYAEFTAEDSYKILHAKTYSYSKQWIERLKEAFNMSKNELQKLDILYGVYLGGIVNQFLDSYTIKELDFIASHGHTIFHKPEERYTLQIGNGQEIANVTGKKVVFDFRTQDVQLGGQGAPLVPIGDQLLFKEYTYCLNLGGFANISYEEDSQRLAFDICPVNIVMNHYVNSIGLPYDDKGVIASKGQIHKKLLLELNNLAFYKATKAKSLGYEFVVAIIFPIIDAYNLSIDDLLCTYVEHIATQIASKVEKEGTILITGGGAYNDFLIHRLSAYLPTNKISVPDSMLIDFKEALIFAFLGLLKVMNKVNCLQSVTNAKKDHSSGRICLPN